MKLQKFTGFTIIETMLFLAISGFLFVAILASTGNSINTQRYRDSVISLQSFLQKQYSETINVSNEFDSNDCSNTSSLRGQSNCVILGRFIATANNGKSLRAYKVIGKDNATADSSQGDIKTFQNYEIQLRSDYETYNFEWDVSLSTDKLGQSPASFSVLLLRSPSSGIIRTFIDKSAETASTDKARTMLADSTTLTNSLKVYVGSNGLVSTPISAILIHANAAVQSDIEVIGEASSDY